MIAPWLVIAPEGVPVIHVDLRVLDDLRVREPDPDDPDDKPERAASDLVLSRDGYEASLYVADGPLAVASIVAKAARAKTSAPAPRTPIRSCPRLVIISSTPSGEPDPGDSLAGREMNLEHAELTIGRTDENDIVLIHRSVSRIHASFVREGGRYTIEDMDAANGVYVNGNQITRHVLRTYDTVDLGHVRMRYFDPLDEIVSVATPPDLAHAVFAGRDPVVQRGHRVLVGDASFPIEDVRELARSGENLALPNGTIIQAALVLLVVDDCA